MQIPNHNRPYPYHPRRPVAASLAALVVLAAMGACGSTNENGVSEQRGGTSTQSNESGATAPHESGGSPMSGGYDATYIKLLGSKKRAGTTVAEKEQLRIGDWRFLYETSETVVLDHPAAVSGSGKTVAPHVTRDGHDWYALLATEGLDGNGAFKRIAWLYRGMPVSSTERPTRKPEPLAVVTDPTLERGADGTIRFAGWIATPPSVNDPSRIDITVPPSGPATITFTDWQEVAQAGKSSP